MSVAESRHDPRRLLRRVYDDHQPARRANVELEEPLSLRPRLLFLWSGDAIASTTAFKCGSSSACPLRGFKMCRREVSSNSTTRTPSGLTASATIERSVTAPDVHEAR